MARHKSYQDLPDEESKLEVSSLVDVCFLLLIYFLATSTITPRESDLTPGLPGIGSPSKIESLVVEVEASGMISSGLGDLRQTFDTDPDRRELPLLSGHLDAYAGMARAAGLEPVVLVHAHDDATHQRVVDVLGALAGAGIHAVTFTNPETP